MASIKEEAQAYEPKQTLTVADLDEFTLDHHLFKDGEGEGKDDDGKMVKYKYNYFKVNDQEYRVPNDVLKQLKKILELRPDAKKVKVIKSGAGLSTKYEVNLVE